jgi:hypothetical protein
MRKLLGATSFPSRTSAFIQEISEETHSRFRADID